MTDLDRLIYAIQQLRFALKSAGMQSNPVITLSPRDGDSLSRMMSMSNQVTVPITAEVRDEHHALIAGVRIYWHEH
jgi:hypothetical protein